jgi:hypothetical protein
MTQALDLAEWSSSHQGIITADRQMRFQRVFALYTIIDDLQVWHKCLLLEAGYTANSTNGVASLPDFTLYQWHYIYALINLSALETIN